MVERFEIELPVPPSVNHIWVHTGRGHYLHPKYREWLTAFDVAVIQSGAVKFPGAVAITITVIPGKGFRINRDLDNCAKAPQDACVRHGIISADDVRIVQRITIQLGEPDGGPARIILAIEAIGEESTVRLQQAGKVSRKAGDDQRGNRGRKDRKPLVKTRPHVRGKGSAPKPQGWLDIR